MSCEHKQAVVIPRDIESVGDGVKVGGLEYGEMYCRTCQDPLPVEDMQFYDEKDLFIAIPADIVDKPQVSEPLE